MLLLSINARNVEVVATTTPLSGGFLRIYGAPRPAAPETGLSGQVLMAELRFASPAFRPPIDGAATANPIEAVSVLASGFPVWFRALEADGSTAVLDGDIGEDLILDRGVLAQGGTLSVTSLVYSRP